MGKLNTDKLLRQCQKIAAEQKKAEAKATEQYTVAETEGEFISRLAEAMGKPNNLEKRDGMSTNRLEGDLMKEGGAMNETKFETDFVDRFDAYEFEEYLTNFLALMRNSAKRYERAVEAEARPNLATQDILHAAELAPSMLNAEDLIPMLHKLRVDRRIAKKELEVTELVKNWYDRHEKAFNELQTVLGNVRKVLNRQPKDSYCWKTDILANKNDWLVSDDLFEGKDD